MNKTRLTRKKQEGTSGCFHDALMYLMDHPQKKDMRLVHGLLDVEIMHPDFQSTWEREAFAHAWIETGGSGIDVEGGGYFEMVTEDFYDYFRVVNGSTVKYTFQEAVDLMKRSHNSGPWAESLDGYYVENEEDEEEEWE